MSLMVSKYSNNQSFGVNPNKIAKAIKNSCVTSEDTTIHAIEAVICKPCPANFKPKDDKITGWQSIIQKMTGTKSNPMDRGKELNKCVKALKEEHPFLANISESYANLKRLMDIKSENEAKQMYISWWENILRGVPEKIDVRDLRFDPPGKTAWQKVKDLITMH